MDNLKWEKLSSRYLVKENWATLRVDSCRMPDGTLIDDYYVLEYPDWVNAVAITDDLKVIIIRQYRHASEAVITELPGGCIDPGETPDEAVSRELLEETGYTFRQIIPLASVYANPSTSANKTYAYLAIGGTKTQEQHLDGREEILVDLLGIDEVRNMLDANLFGQALHVSSLYYAFRYIEKHPELFTAPAPAV